MKNKFLLSMFILFLSASLMAQPQGQSICGQPAKDAWAEGIAITTAPAPPDNAEEIIAEIIDVIGLKPNFEVKAANVPNAAAVIYGGKRYVLYNPNFINALTKSTGSKWAAISVLAHEIGHHLDGHTLSQNGSEPESELEADEFSGFVLRKMGASLSESQAAMKLAASQRGDRTHPGQSDRLIAIANGWNKADGQITGKTDVARTIARPAPQQQTIAQTDVYPVTQVQSNAIDDRSIIGDVHFSADASSAFYITTRYNLVKVQNNRVAVIGKLTPLNSNRFPYLIYDEDNNQLLVDAYGNILTTDGDQVGKLRARNSKQ